MKIDKEWEHVLIPQHYFRPVFITFIKYNQLKVHEPFILKLLESSGFAVFFSLCNISGIMFGFSLFMLAVFKIKTSNDHTWCECNTTKMMEKNFLAGKFVIKM